jgi:histidine triad (HIT) family protein
MSDFYCENVFSGKDKVDIVKETDNVLAFHHTKPSWTYHVVIVPKKHFLNLLDTDSRIINEILSIAKEIIKEHKLDQQNYKIITNGGSFQDSKHLHFHLVSGDKIK